MIDGLSPSERLEAPSTERLGKRHPPDCSLLDVLRQRIRYRLTCFEKVSPPCHRAGYALRMDSRKIQSLAFAFRKRIT